MLSKGRDPHLATHLSDARRRDGRAAVWKGVDRVDGPAQIVSDGRERHFIGEGAHSILKLLELTHILRHLDDVGTNGQGLA